MVSWGLSVGYIEERASAGHLDQTNASNVKKVLGHLRSERTCSKEIENKTKKRNLHR